MNVIEKLGMKTEEEEFQTRLTDACTRLDVDISTRTIKIKQPYTNDPMVQKIADVLQRIISENPDIDIWYNNGRLMLQKKER